MKTKRIMLFFGLIPILVSCSILKESPVSQQEYEVLAWNDLGMHCYDADFSVFSILPPYDTLWAQVIAKGSPPRLVSEGIVITYEFENNTRSADKTNFWQYAEKLFGTRLQADTGLRGKSVRGRMDATGDHFAAEGIPLTEICDDGSILHYQTASVTVKDTKGNVLARTRFVAPLSTEMHCSNCHDDGKMMGIVTNNYRTNILALHDRMNKTTLLNDRPVLCGSCHSSNALGTNGDVISLSHAIHRRHGFIQDSLEGCYNCHPGKNTRCLRGVMLAKGMTCTNCHGNMRSVADVSRQPWIQEPDCAKCHPYGAEPGKLYRMSRGHGGLYCEACHNSTHAEYPSSMQSDNMQPLRLQQTSLPIAECSACHTDAKERKYVHKRAGRGAS
jgi:hypothetical protein